ncbi:MAG: NADH-quinone oxidoreductase subunit C [Actinomycetota bacterium]
MTDTEASESTEVDEAEEVETDEAREALLADLTDAFGDALVEHHLVPGRDLWVRVDATRWIEVVTALRADLDFGYFDFLSGIDWMIAPWGRYEDTAFGGLEADDEGGGSISLPEGPGYAGGDSRFQLLLRVFSVERQLGVTIKADLDEDYPEVPTISSIYAGADWHERETWEMFGFTFVGHPHLVHMYLPTDFEGFPLRKDYPLLAREVKPWPGVVDVEPIPEHLEAELEAAVMEAAEQAEGAS